jgi:hypothetical protein
MIIEHKFLRTKNGVTSFAAVGVSSRPSDELTIVWSDAASGLRGAYETAAEEGVQLAAREHQRRGGQPQSVEIASIVETPVDTRSDAVRCAAALAAWKSWGHLEAEASVMFEDGAWKVTFASAQT